MLNIIFSNNVEVHADTWLHGGGDWLGEIGGSVWDLVAFLDSEIEVNIGVKWDWLSTNTWPGVGITVSKVIWAMNLSIGTLGELTNSQFEALEGLMGTEGENEVSSITLVSGIRHHSSVLEVGLE